MGWLPRHGIAPGARGQKGNQIWAMYANGPRVAVSAGFTVYRSDKDSSSFPCGYTGLS
jgi:hypothetical protein